MRTNDERGLAARAHRFLADGLWRIDDAARSRVARAAIRMLRIAWSAVRAFRAHGGPLHASALTYYTLFAMVPILALGLALARVFGGEEIARQQLHRQTVEWVGDAGSGTAAAAPGVAEDESAGRIFARRVVAMEDRLFSQIDRIGLGTLGGIGLAGLLWMVIGVLARVEASFNTVWGVQRGRTLWRCFTDYLSVVLIVPLLAVAASTVPVVDMAARHAAVAGVSAGSIQTVVGSLLVKKSIVLLFTALAFTCLLIFMPNTRVRFAPALAGGALTAVLFLSWLKFCTLAQVGIVKYSLLYGGFALLPILLAWIYVSWEILLFGAELTCTLQDGAACPTDRLGRPASPRSRFLLTAALFAEAARAVHEEGAPFEAQAFIAARRLPGRLVRGTLADLVAAGLLAEVAGRPGCYLPCRDAATLTVADLARLVMNDGLSTDELGLQRLDAGVLALADEMDRDLGRVLNRPLAPQ